MVKISLDSKVGRECLRMHKEAYAILDKVLEDLAKGNEVKTIGRGGRVIVLSSRNGRNTITKRYYKKICDLNKKESFPCLLPETIHKIVSKVGEFESTEKDKRGLRRAKRVIEQVYSYERFGKNLCPEYIGGVLRWKANKNGWGAWKFIKMLDVRSCVYCNAETIFSLLLTNKLAGTEKEYALKKGVPKRSALDHFYSHSKWPFLGITLSNLIPACTRCNTNIKGARELNWKKHIYPYASSFHEGARFALALRDAKDRLRMKESDLYIAILPNGDVDSAKLAMESSSFFHLSEVYNQLHKRDALTVLQRITALPQSYREFLAQKYPGIKEMVLDNICRGASLSAADILSHNLSKLTIDIEAQFR